MIGFRYEGWDSYLCIGELKLDFEGLFTVYRVEG